MEVIIDSEKGKAVSCLLYTAFSTTGIHGNNEMPEDLLPKGLVKGSLDHIFFITLTVSIDYQRDAPALWRSARLTFEDPETRYLFDPKMIFVTPMNNQIKDMQKYRLSKKQQQDAFIWRTVALTFYKKWQGNPLSFLENCSWDAPTVLARLKTDTHSMNGKSVVDFPFLRGNKIGPLWLRMLRDNIGVTQLKNLDAVPIPVDIHVARASLCLGVVRGSFDGKLDEIFPAIRKAWFEGVKGASVNKRSMIALDVDEPLWHLSKYGCTMRIPNTGFCPNRSSCEAKNQCIPGIVEVSSNHVHFVT